MQTPLNEFSIKVSPKGLNNNRMVRYVSPDDPRINKYLGNAGTDFLKSEDYTNVLLGVDGLSGAQKLYLEDICGNIRAIELHSGQIKRRIYLRINKADPRLKLRSSYFPQVLCFSADEKFNPIALKTTHLLINSTISDTMEVIMGLAKRHASDHIDALKGWLSRELESIVTWLGLSDDCFTIYYMKAGDQ